MTRSQQEVDEFEQSAKGPRGNLVSELWGFMRENKKWWLAPIIVVLLLVTLLVLFSGTAAAPFIYTLF